jgi:hypothetical protein
LNSLNSVESMASFLLLIFTFLLLFNFFKNKILIFLQLIEAINHDISGRSFNLSSFWRIICPYIARNSTFCWWTLPFDWNFLLLDGPWLSGWRLIFISKLV